MRAGPVRELLRPGRLRIRQVRGAEHSDENLRLADFASGGIGDSYPLARVIDERLVTRDMMLARHRREPPFEPAKQIAEPAVAIALPMARRLWPAAIAARPNSRCSKTSSVTS